MSHLPRRGKIMASPGTVDHAVVKSWPPKEPFTTSRKNHGLPRGHLPRRAKIMASPAAFPRRGKIMASQGAVYHVVVKSWPPPRAFTIPW